MNETSTVLTAAQLREAATLTENIEQLQSQIGPLASQLTESQNKLTALMGVNRSNGATSGTKRVLSAEARAKIAAGQKARWAAKKAAEASVTPTAEVAVTPASV